MTDNKLDRFMKITKEISNIENSAEKLKDIAAATELPLVFYNTNRMLAIINILKEDISIPISYLK